MIKKNLIFSSIPIVKAIAGDEREATGKVCGIIRERNSRERSPSVTTIVTQEPDIMKGRSQHQVGSGDGTHVILNEAIN